MEHKSGEKSKTMYAQIDEKDVHTEVKPVKERGAHLWGLCCVGAECAHASTRKYDTYCLALVFINGWACVNLLIL